VENKILYGMICILALLTVIGLLSEPLEIETKTYGELWARNITISITTQKVYFNVTNLTQGEFNNVIITNDFIKILEKGVYAVNSQFSFSDGANTEFHLALGINGSRANDCHSQRKIGTGGDVGSASFSCFSTFSTGDKITVMIENLDNLNNPDIKSINLNINKIN